MSKNPPAFPNKSFQDWKGMTLRDWFAGQALAGLLAHDVAHGPIMQSHPTAVAIACGEYADAMLEERGRRNAA